MAKRLIRFDWAMKRLLRDKANFDILEGFLSELLQEDIVIQHILESESNKETENDRYNRVDLLVENSKGELIIIEIQNNKELDYFQRMLYGVSKAVVENMKEGQPYADVKKIIAITIAYFDLGQGEDYVYHGITSFTGFHRHDLLALSEKQKELYRKPVVHNVYPEYWIIKVDKFDDRVRDKLDEWIYFFKNDEIKSGFTAKGLQAASDRLDQLRLSENERTSYRYFLKNLHDIASYNYNREIEYDEYVKERAAKMAELEKTVVEKSKALEEAAEAKNKALEEAAEAKNKALEEAEAEKNKALTEAEAVKNKALTEAEAEKNKALTEAEAEKNKALTEAEAEKNKALTEAEAEKNKALTEAKAEKNKALTEAKAEKNKALTEAKAEKNKEIIEKSLRKGYAIEDIIDLTGLSAEEIDAVKKAMNL